MADSQSPSQRLQTLLGYRPSAKPSPTADLLREVMTDILSERQKEGKVRARSLLEEAIKLEGQRVELVKKFEKEVEKFDKELGKLMNQIEGLMRGTPAPEPTDETVDPPAAS